GLTKEVVERIALKGNEAGRGARRPRSEMHQCRCGCDRVLLAAADERRLSARSKRDRSRANAERSRRRGQLVPAFARSANQLPRWCEGWCVELIAYDEVAAERRRGRGGLFQHRPFVNVGHAGVAVENRWPAVAPCYRQHERFATDVREIGPVRANAEKDGPPVAARCLYEIGVPGRCDRCRTGRRKLTLCEDRVVVVRNVGTLH